MPTFFMAKVVQIMLFYYNHQEKVPKFLFKGTVFSDNPNLLNGLVPIV